MGIFSRSSEESAKADNAKLKDTIDKLDKNMKEERDRGGKLNAAGKDNKSFDGDHPWWDQ